MNNQTENMENQTPTTESTFGNPGALSFTVPAVTLRAAIKACAPAMSSDVNRAVIHGVFFELKPAPTAAAIRDGHAGHVLSVVATDGRRLHVAQIPVYDHALPLSPGRSLAFILPAPAVKMLLKTCFPAKVKGADSALLTFTRRAAAIVNPSPVQWMTVNTPAGEVSNPEQGGNYPCFRQIIHAPTIADDNFNLRARDVRNMEEMRDEAETRFTSACLRAACQSAVDRQLPFTEAQVKGMISPTVKRMIRKAYERNNSTYFERGPAGRLIPIPLAIGPAPAWQMMDDGRLFTNGEDKVCLNHGGNPCTIGNPPAPASACFNPRYLSDMADALDAFDAAPGATYGPLQAHDKHAAFVLRASLPLDSGKGFSLYLVIMPQRVG
jgi:hypothetical protein